MTSLKTSASTATDADTVIPRAVFDRLIHEILAKKTRRRRGFVISKLARRYMQRKAEQKIVLLLRLAGDVAKKYSRSESIRPHHLRTAVELYRRGYDSVPKSVVEEIMEEVYNQ